MGGSGGTLCANMDDNMDVVFEVDLYCTSQPKEPVQHETITFPSSSIPPSTIGDLTRKIEDIHQIPASQMKVELNDVTLQSDTSLDGLSIRTGDTFTVHYYSKADCQEINECVEWLSELLDTLEGWECSEPFEYPKKSGVLYNLENLFLPWFNPVKYANKLYFVSKNGLAIIMRILDIMVSFQIRDIPWVLHNTKTHLVSICWNITEDVFLYKAVIAAGGLETMTKVLMQVPIKPFAGVENGYYVKESMRNALGVFGNLCELPEIRMEIASNFELVEQIVSVPFCPSYDDSVPHSVVVILLELSYTRETHSHLLSHERFKEFISKNQFEEFGPLQKLIRHYKSVLCSILLLVSPQYFTDEDKKVIQQWLQEYVKRSDPYHFTEEEEKRGVTWETMKPYIVVLYQFKNEEVLGKVLNELCKRTILIALETMLVRQHQRQILVKEGLVDFLLCVQWYCTGVVWERVVRMMMILRMSVEAPYNPPSLLNITRAAVAVHYCGLEDTTTLSVSQLTEKLGYNVQQE